MKKSAGVRQPRYEAIGRRVICESMEKATEVSKHELAALVADGRAAR